MLTKYILEIGETKYELTSEHIHNWDQILCAYSRKDYNGIVRSFTSKFEFVGEAYDILLKLYLEFGVKALAKITVVTITDNWEWEEQFSAPLDFSTISWNDIILSISAVDNSLASLITSQKGTKFEFAVGSGIHRDGILRYDRLVMKNCVEHEIMSNAKDERPSMIHSPLVLLASKKNMSRAMTYIVGESETFENSPVSFQDETEDNGSYFLKIEDSSAEVTVETDITFYPSAGPLGAGFNGLEIHLMSFNASNPSYNDTYVDIGCILKCNAGEAMTNLGCFSSLDVLKRRYPNPPQNAYALIGKSDKSSDVEAVYMTPNSNIPERVEWLPGVRTYTGPRGSTSVICTTRRYIYRHTIKNSGTGTLIGLFYKGDVIWDHWYDPRGELYIPITKTSIRTSWKSRANAIDIDAIAPKTVAQSLIDRIVGNKINSKVFISDFDNRLKETYILAAESVRGIPQAKFYSSFNEFCDWMQTVFGYTYYIGESVKSKYVGSEPFFTYWPINGMEVTDDICPGQYTKVNQLVYLHEIGKFAVLHDKDFKFCTRWEKSQTCENDEAYNDPKTGKARLDKVFVDTLGEPFYIDNEYKMQGYIGNPSKCTCDTQNLYFCHRSELYEGKNLLEISSCRELAYNVNSSALYGSIEVGYDKQDYETECGRDEWNFGASYTTGIDVSDKKLSLKSKYRADCYGLEFMAQKRAQDTTDDKSDNTVFFVLCEYNEEASEDVEDSEDITATYELKIKRGATVSGALSDSVFNGEFSPYYCIKANEEYISAMCQPLVLRFASADGNADIVIDDVPIDADISICKPLYTVGQLTFKSGHVDLPKDVNSVIIVRDKGVTYRGFLSSVEIQYAHTEAAKYKLIVKDIEL